MSKAIVGAVLVTGAILAASVATGGLAAGAGALLSGASATTNALAGIALAGISMEAGAIADALTSNRGMTITTRQPAAFRQIILGTQRVGGNIIYASTTGSHHDQYNRIIVISGHVCHSILGLYLDGRKVYWDTSSYANGTRNGVNFGGHADGNDHIGPDGNTYNFGGLVFCEARYGDQMPGDVPSSMTANDPTWAATADGSPYVGGCTYVYLKIEDDASMFPGQPEIRFDVNGKCDIFDPRTSSQGFTTNWALLVADRMTDPKFGLGMDPFEINQAQLIAAANVCDEPVPLANGDTEARYSCHWHGDTGTGPADVIVNMMSAAAGRVSRIGGEWYIWPAYWQGPSFSLDKNSLIEIPEWEPKRSLNDRFNRVTGTYTAPNYPYNAAGNLYDSNRWYDGTLENNFQYGFQPTNYPQFAMDTDHGYPSDQWLTADGGNPLPKEIPMNCTLSIAQAQRVAKIYLMRNRYEGKGTFICTLGAWGLQPTDVMQMTFSEFLGWENKLLEVSDCIFHIEDRSSTNEGKSLACWVELKVNETGSDVYTWSATEERNAYDDPATMAQAPWVPPPPTNIVLTSSSATGVLSPVGEFSPRILVTWNEPLDILATQVQIRYAPAGTGVWIAAPAVPITDTRGYISGVVAGQSYDVEIRSVRSNGSASVWVETSTPYTVPSKNTVLVSRGISPNASSSVADTSVVDSVAESGAATVRVYDGSGGDGVAWTLYQGSASTLIPCVHITGLDFATSYYIVYDVSTSQTLAIPSVLGTLNDNYYVLTPTPMTTCSATYTGDGGGTGGGTPGGGGTRCFALGTLVHTSLGVMPNTEFLSRHSAGEEISLAGRDGHEKVLRAKTVDVVGWAEVLVAGESFSCSRATKLLSERRGEYLSITSLRVGDKVETLNGFQPIEDIVHHDDRLTVITVCMDGPSHEYLVGSGLRTHNFKLPDDEGP